MRIVTFLLILTIISCQSENSTTELDNPTSGRITIVADESLAPIVEAEWQVFSSIYKYANIKFIYAPESELFNYVMNDSAQTLILARTLNKDEESYLQKIKITPRSTKVAYDAIALIVNKENKDTNLTYDQLQKLFSGEYQSWKDLNSQSSLGTIQIVFDNAKSGGVRYIRENIIYKDSLPENCYAVKTNTEVIDYVSKNKNAIGLIGVNWISDTDDTKVKGFLNKVTTMGISNPNDTVGETGEFYKPYQAYMALKQYPLLREIYITSIQGRNGLGTGFAAFVASDKGQRIILKSGIMPATQPVRVVNFN